MRLIDSAAIEDAVRKTWVEIATRLPSDVFRRIESAVREETNPAGKEILEQILENARLAESEKIPICQDTGFPLIFIKQGQEIKIEGEGLSSAITKGIVQGSREAYLRSSVVNHPFSRENTGCNAPPVIHFELLPGDGFKIMVAAKGAGSENVSFFRPLNPNDGAETVKNTVLEHVKTVAASACPPLVIGVGIGGTAETAMLKAKKACLRNLDETDSPMRQFEEELLEAVNSSGIGPAGMGGRTTALAVNVETFACHIASLPVAVNINCHALRRKEIEL